MQGFKNSLTYLENIGIVKTSCTFSNENITAIGKGLNIDNPINLPENAVVLPGFIDQHIHGAGGFDVMDATKEGLSKIANSVASEGVTSFLATTMTQSEEKIISVMKCVNNYINSKPKEGAELIGVHLEGPFINPKKAGAQPIEYIISPSLSKFNEFNNLSGNNIKIVTIAPEMEGATEFIAGLDKSKTVVSIGHSNATFNELEKALDNGASQITHTFNAQSPFTHREIGVAGGAMLLNDLACEVICDLVHVSPQALKLLFKNKPHDKIIFISDAMRAKNLGDTQSELGGQKVFVHNGQARLENGTLAGSVLKLNDAIKNAVTVCKMPFCTAINCVTANPAKNLKVFDKIGSISVNKKANFTVMDINSFDILLTVRNGEIIYKANY